MYHSLPACEDYLRASARVTHRAHFLLAIRVMPTRYNVLP